MQRADLVVHTPGVSELVLDRCRRDAARELLQGAIGAAAVSGISRQAPRVRAGQHVCVLAPGDAFGAADGEQWRQSAARAGLSVTVVPGIAAGLDGAP
jgi:uroporphyrin-III C-methyltransferase/precorrin-2 dehydrogenase/sirohydrochlorin ferrochelatase